MLIASAADIRVAGRDRPTFVFKKQMTLLLQHEKVVVVATHRVGTRTQMHAGVGLAPTVLYERSR